MKLPPGFEPNEGQSNAFAIIFDRLQDPSPDTPVTTVAGPGGTTWETIWTCTCRGHWNQSTASLPRGL